MRLPSLKEVAQNGIADGAKIYMDGAGVWNRIVWFFYTRGLVPKTMAVRKAAIVVASVATATAKANIKTPGVLASVAMELGSDATSEIGARILALPTETPAVIVLSKSTSLSSYRPQRGQGDNSVSKLLKFLGTGIGRVILAIALAVLLFSGFVLMTFRLDLLAAPPILLLTMLAFFVLWLSLSLAWTGRIAKGIAITCSVTLLWISFSRSLPGTSEGIKTVVSYQDQKNRERALESTVEILEPIPCDSSNSDKIQWFGTVGTTGEPIARVFYSYRNGRVTCFPSQGVDPLTGRPVKKVTPDIVKTISAQEPLRPIPLTASPTRTAQIAPPQQIMVATPVETAPLPTPAQPSPYIARSGQIVIVMLEQVLDARWQNVGSKAPATLVTDIADKRDGIILAARNSPVELVITSKDQMGNAYYTLALALMALPTPKRVPLPALVTGSVEVPLSNAGMMERRHTRSMWARPEYILSPGSKIELALQKDWQVPVSMVQ